MRNTYIRKIISFLLALHCVFALFGVTTTFAEGKEKASEFIAYGVDVSSWQGRIDWQKVKNTGKSFAILRAGTTRGKDSYFEENYMNAKKAGIHVGCYFYTYATTVEEAEKDADMLLGWLEGKQFEYPVYYDMENEIQLASGMTTAVRTEMCMAFMNKMKDNGWFTGTYANANWYSKYLDKAILGAENELWLASWTSSGEPTRDYRNEYGLWQYSATGKVDGISTDVDLDVSYIDYPDIIISGGYNGYSAEIEYLDEEWVITASDGVNVREKAGTVFPKMGFLKNGTRIHVTAKIRDSRYTWGRVYIDGVEGWCALDYAKQVKSTLEIKKSGLKITGENLIIGLKEGEEVYDNMFSVNGLAKIKTKQTKNGFGTGTEIRLMLGETVVDTYYVVIDGDINGDCYIDSFDLTYSTALTNFEISYDETSPEFMAADLNKDGVCDVFDCEILATLMLYDNIKKS